MKIRRKTVLLDAVVATVAGAIDTIPYEAGDVIVVHADGVRYPVERKTFFATFDVVSSEGHVPYPDGIFGDGWICGNCGAASASDAVARGLDPCPGKRS